MKIRDPDTSYNGHFLTQYQSLYLKSVGKLLKLIKNEATFDDHWTALSMIYMYAYTSPFPSTDRKNALKKSFHEIQKLQAADT